MDFNFDAEFEKLKAQLGVTTPAAPSSAISNPPAAPKTNQSSSNEGMLDVYNGPYQAPIKDEWKNSGGFMPGVAINKTHPKGHDGLDLRAALGTSLYPMCPGVVEDLGYGGVSGNFVRIRHAKNLYTFYGHMNSINVSKNEKVDMNTVIGTVGKSGNAKGTAAHCHFEVHLNNAAVDPAKYFSVPAYSNISKDEKLQLDGVKMVDKLNVKKSNFNAYLLKKYSQFFDPILDNEFDAHSFEELEEQYNKLLNTHPKSSNDYDEMSILLKKMYEMNVNRRKLDDDYHHRQIELSKNEELVLSPERNKIKNEKGKKAMKEHLESLEKQKIEPSQWKIDPEKLEELKKLRKADFNQYLVVKYSRIKLAHEHTKVICGKCGTYMSTCKCMGKTKENTKIEKSICDECKK